MGPSFDLLMAEEMAVATREASLAGPEQADLTDASLRALIQGPRMRSKLRQLFAEGGSGEGTTAVTFACTSPSASLVKETTPRPEGGVESAWAEGSGGTTPAEGEKMVTPGEPYKGAPEVQLGECIEG